MPSPEELVGALAAAIDSFERAYMQLMDEIDKEKGDRQPLREIYFGLTQGLTRLNASKAYLGGRLGLQHGKLVPVRGATLEGKYGTKRKTWQHDLLKGVVSEAIIEKHIDPDSGTLDCPPGILMREMLDAVSITGWKVTTLRKLGFTNKDIARYCDETKGNFNIQVYPSGGPSILKDDNADSD